MKTFRVGVLCAAILGTSVVAIASQELGPESARLQIIQTEEAIYPGQLLSLGITAGTASVLISVAPDGQLLDALVTRYSHPAFGREALRALRAWRYKVNAVPDRPPSAVCTEVNFSFEAAGAIVSLDVGSALQQISGGNPYAHSVLCSPRELDRPPAPTHTVAPIHPRSSSGRATLEFIIDENGRARMPILVSSPDLELGARAAEALTQWTFTPPTRKGRAVAVRVRQEFVFETPDQPQNG